mmetsp:Transcript_50987/g.150301  ORF Transcript_50987/g.150301 Transcript_50987/m.150301 type:complete len:241 (-) Transcript_50987:227-949(-)
MHARASALDACARAPRFPQVASSRLAAMEPHLLAAQFRSLRAAAANYAHLTSPDSLNASMRWRFATDGESKFNFGSLGNPSGAADESPSSGRPQTSPDHNRPPPKTSGRCNVQQGQVASWGIRRLLNCVNGSRPVWDKPLLQAMRSRLQKNLSLSPSHYPHAAEDVVVALRTFGRRQLSDGGRFAVCCGPLPPNCAALVRVAVPRLAGGVVHQPVGGADATRRARRRLRHHGGLQPASGD